VVSVGGHGGAQAASIYKQMLNISSMHNFCKVYNNIPVSCMPEQNERKIAKDFFMRITQTNKGFSDITSTLIIVCNFSLDSFTLSPLHAFTPVEVFTLLDTDMEV
jgi:hypothetical protein